MTKKAMIWGKFRAILPVGVDRLRLWLAEMKTLRHPTLAFYEIMQYIIRK